MHAKQALADLRAARAQQACDAQHLAPAQLEGNVRQRATGGARAGLEVQMLHPQHLVPDGHRLLGVHVRDFPANHHGDDLVAVGLLGVDAADVLAVAQHRQPVGDLKDLLHAVGDVNDAHALGRESANHPEQLLRLRLGDGRGRFVHDQYARVQGNRLGDLHHLLFAHAQRLQRPLRAQIQLQQAQVLLRLLLLGALVHKAQLVGLLTAHKHVFGDGELLHHLQFLVNLGDAQLPGDDGAADVLQLAVDVDLALVVHQRSRQDVHQRGLARAVFTHQRQYLACVQAEIDLVQRPHRAEALADANHFQKLAHTRAPFHSFVPLAIHSNSSVSPLCHVSPVISLQFSDLHSRFYNLIRFIGSVE